MERKRRTGVTFSTHLVSAVVLGGRGGLRDWVNHIGCRRNGFLGHGVLVAGFLGRGVLVAGPFSVVGFDASLCLPGCVFVTVHKVRCVALQWYKQSRKDEGCQ